MATWTLLYVEDSDADHYIVDLATKELDFPVRLCRVRDGEEGIWFLEKTHGYENAPTPDLVLLDLNLPKRDGFEVLAVVRASDALRSIPVIMFTTSRAEYEKKKALALGANDYISKPGTITEVIETLRTA